MRCGGFLLIGISAVVSGVPQTTAADIGSQLAGEARAILAEKCFACHGPDLQEADLKLDTRDDAIRMLDSGRQAVVPDDADASELIRRITTADRDARMPPEGDPLSEKQVAVLRQWIENSAPYTQHWAYSPLQSVTPPLVDGDTAITSPIDHYVLAKLRSRGITPAPRADRATLIKRLHYDLIGLPPSPELVDAFVSSGDPGRYERLVDELLGSQHFGERWARHWLDKARYADSDGYEKDRPRPNAWRYRDWVIDAINRDMPMDQFTIEQLAGDLLPDASSDQHLATAFHRQTLTNTEGGVDQEQFRVDAVFDRTETTGAVWLGLTVGCARCHSHKYDSISQEEYYRLFAFFNNGDEVDLAVPISEAALEDFRKRRATHESQLAVLRERLETAKHDWQRPMETWLGELRSEIESSRAITFHDLEIRSAEASMADHRFTPQDDGSFLVSGVVPDRDVDYTLIAACRTEGPITGVRIDVLADDSLPSNGPGRVAHGNFVLSELTLSVDDQPIKLSGIEASFSQSNFAYSKAVDGKLDTGWAVSPQMGKDHHAHFRFDRQQVIPPESIVEITLRQHHGSQHAIGRFRLRLTTGVDLDQLAPESIREIVSLDPTDQSQEQRRELSEHFFRNEFTATKSLYAELDQLLKNAPDEPTMQVRVITARTDLRETRVFDRGDFLSPGHAVAAGGLSVLPPIVDQGDDGLDRLDLARWLFDPGNPLPPRVLANHVWSHLFGTGLVRTANDFGVRGQPPTHPQLLDWLAAEYRRVGWSRKKLIKAIVMSATYQQSSRHRLELSETDPQNLLLARQNRFRVPAEVVRDLCLSVSGLLSEKVGGPSVYPPLPADVAALSYANNFKWQTSQGEDRYRRGMYTFFKRTSPHPNLTTFDCPDSNTTSVSRRSSNTPLQALTLLNNDVFFEAAQAFASRAMAIDDTDDCSRLTVLLRQCLVRKPSEFEVQRFLDLLNQSRQWYAEHEEEAARITTRHHRDHTTEVETAAWVSVARIALNLDEFLTRE